MTPNELTIAILEANITTLEAHAAALQTLSKFNGDFRLDAMVIQEQVNIIREKIKAIPVEPDAIKITGRLAPGFAPSAEDVCATSKAMEAGEAYERGFCAYKNGVAKKDNPNKTPLGYMRTVADISWERGWLAAETFGADSNPPTDAAAEIGKTLGDQVAQARIDLILKALNDTPMVPISGAEANRMERMELFHGRVAAYNGFPESDNPWDGFCELRDAWSNGWRSARKNMEDGLSPKYAQGYRSFAKGISIDMANNLVGIDRQEWLRGWEHARHDKPV